MTPSGIVKRSVAIAGHRTSVSLEEPFWAALHDIARRRGRSVHGVIAEIDRERGGRNLSSAIRVFVLAALRERAGVELSSADAQAAREG
jgi:predicted DNA-binding ribbon-helix-helix protein